MDMEETKRKELDFEYKDWDGQKCMKVWMEIEGCRDTGNISVAFYSEENGGDGPCDPGYGRFRHTAGKEPGISA